MRKILLILFVLSIAKIQAQVKMTAGTEGAANAIFAFDFGTPGNIDLDVKGGINGAFDFSGSTFVLSGANQTLTITGGTLSLASLIVNTTGNPTIIGTVTISEDLLLKSGILTASSTNSKLVYSGKKAKDLKAPSPPISYINGRLFIKGAGPRTFPIGNASGYLPVTLQSVSDADTEIGFEAIAGDPTISPSLLPQEVQSVFPYHYWMMTNGNSGSYAGGSPIQLSLNAVDTYFENGDATILEVSSSGTLTNLGGVVANPDVTSREVTTSTGQKYALGKLTTVTVNIHRVITPNGDGQNDYLYIDGIDFYTDNTVKLVDRWGVVHFEKANFKNYNLANPSDFDFNKLSNGNYICVVELGSGPKIKPKMISVVK